MFGSRTYGDFDSNNTRVTAVAWRAEAECDCCARNGRAALQHRGLVPSTRLPFAWTGCAPNAA
jgi:hypothetical protein